MERRTAVALDDALKTVVDYYSREIGRVPDADKQAFLLARCKMDLHLIRCGPRLIMRLVLQV